MTHLAETMRHKVRAHPSDRAGRPTARAMLRCLGYSATIACAGCVMQSDFDEKHPATCVFLPTGETFVQSSPIFLSAGNWTVSVERNGWTQQITNETADKWRCRAAMAETK